MQDLANSRSEAASNIDIPATSLSPGSSGDLNFSSNDAGGAQVIQEVQQSVLNYQQSITESTCVIPMEQNCRSNVHCLMNFAAEGEWQYRLAGREQCAV